MTIHENIEQLQLRVIDYLYGELSSEEMARFEEDLLSQPALKQALENEQRLDSAFPAGSQPVIDSKRLEGNRWLLRQNLERAARTQFSLRQWLQGLAERPFTIAFQAAAMAATFVLGILISTPAEVQPGLPGSAQVAVADTTLSPLQLINPEDYEIFQLKVNNYDSVSGDIDLSFSLASETRLTGNVADQNIHGLMAAALQGDIDSAARLDTIHALQPVVLQQGANNKVFEALIHVLTNDQNPGVRYQAVQSLVQLSHQEQVRDALRFALSQDVNQGVRVEAFQALVNYPDEKTLAVFRQQMENDSNEFIRTQARFIVEESDGNSIAL